MDEEKQTKILRRLKNAQKKSKLSIAVPGSILDNAQSLELRTYLAGQIARAAAIYKVDEIIIFNDQLMSKGDGKELDDEEEFSGKTNEVHLMETTAFKNVSMCCVVGFH